MSEKMRSWTALIVVGLSLIVVVTALATSSGGETDRVHALAAQLKCPVCESESIADSPAQVARDSYELIAQKVEEGWTDQEILDFFVAAYGEIILLDPETGGARSVLWIAPIAALAFGIVVVATRKARHTQDISESQRRRLEEEISRRA